MQCSMTEEQAVALGGQHRAARGQWMGRQFMFCVPQQAHGKSRLCIPESRVHANRAAGEAPGALPAPAPSQTDPPTVAELSVTDQRGRAGGRRERSIALGMKRAAGLACWRDKARLF